MHFLIARRRIIELQSEMLKWKHRFQSRSMNDSYIKCPSSDYGIHLPATLGWTIELNIRSNFICIYYINDI